MKEPNKDEQIQMLLGENAQLRRLHTDACLALDGLRMQFLQLKAQAEALQKQCDAVTMAKKAPMKKKKK